MSMAIDDDELTPEDVARQERMSRRGRKSRPIDIYLKPGMREDDLLYALWKAYGRGARPQGEFRKLLIDGVKRQIEHGDMPLSILKDPDVALHLDVLGDLDRDRRPPYMVLAAPHAGHPSAPATPPASPLAAFAPKDPAPAPEKPKPKRGLDPNLMG